MITASGSASPLEAPLPQVNVVRLADVDTGLFEFFRERSAEGKAADWAKARPRAKGGAAYPAWGVRGVLGCTIRMGYQTPIYTLYRVSDAHI